MPVAKFREPKTDTTHRSHTHVAPTSVRACCDEPSRWRFTFGASFKEAFDAARYVSIYVDDGHVFWWFNNKGGLPLIKNASCSNTLRTVSSRETIETLIVPNFQIADGSYYRDIVLFRAAKQPSSGNLFIAPIDKTTLF